MNLIRTTLLYVVGSLLVCVGVATDGDTTLNPAPHVVDAVAGISDAQRSITAGDSVSRESVLRVARRSPSTIRDVSAPLSASPDSRTIERSAFEAREERPLELDSYDACDIAVLRRWSRRRDRRGRFFDPPLT